jgi:hypothetical protein
LLSTGTADVLAPGRVELHVGPEEQLDEQLDERLELLLEPAAARAILHAIRLDDLRDLINYSTR